MNRLRDIRLKKEHIKAVMAFFFLLLFLLITVFVMWVIGEQPFNVSKLVKDVKYDSKADALGVGTNLDFVSTGGENYTRIISADEETFIVGNLLFDSFRENFHESDLIKYKASIVYLKINDSYFPVYANNRYCEFVTLKTKCVFNLELIKEKINILKAEKQKKDLVKQKEKQQDMKMRALQRKR